MDKIHEYNITYKDLYGGRMKVSKCIVCGRSLNDGIMLKGKLICTRCESRMINENNCTDIYRFIKNKIKKHIVTNLKYYG